MQSPKRPKSTKTTKKRQTSKEDAFGLRAEPLLEALDSAIFQEGGALVDSPGFQEFGLSHLTLNDIMRGMPEIRDRVEHCRFTNCRHLQEPGCAVKKAVEDGEIDPERYAFYKELAEEAIARESGRY